MSGAQLYGRNAAAEWNLVCQEHSCMVEMLLLSGI